MVEVSVVVPVYNAEPFLQECIESLLAQTLQQIEIILVDDGSSDKSVSICDEYAEKYSNISVVHQANKGQSAARNEGIKVASGKYIAFCDSDDMIKPEMLKKMVNAAKLHCANVVICGYEFFPQGKIVIPNVKKETVLSPMEFVDSYPKLHSGNELCFSVRLLIEKNFLQSLNITFDESIMFGEDVIYNIDVIMQAEKIYVLNEALYRYRINNSNSFMQKYKPLLTKWVNQQYAAKINRSRKYGLDNNKMWMDDMSYYYITRFQSMMFSNMMKGPIDNRKRELSAILNSPALRENYKIKLMFADGIKQGVFGVLCKLKAKKIVYHFVRKWYG